MLKVYSKIVFIAMFALVAYLTFPVRVQAHHASSEQLTMQSQEEHEALHKVLDKLTEKYSNDAEVKALLDALHESQHQKMATLEQLGNLMASKQAGKQEVGDQKAEELTQRIDLLDKEEHDTLHELMKILTSKYPNDSEAQTMLSAYHETYHKHQETRKELLQ